MHEKVVSVPDPGFDIRVVPVFGEMHELPLAIRQKTRVIFRVDEKEKSIVIDVGEPKGDVEESSVKGKASFLNTVPGGVGPMTVVCLMENAVELVEKKRK